MVRMSRLPGNAIKNFGWSVQRHQLWLTESYLLCREISGFREEVTRYYYRDIQAVVTAPTNQWKTCNWLTGSLLVFLSGCAIYAAITGSSVAYVLAVVAAVVTLIVLLGNLILGPSCKTTLYTAATEAPLHSLGRRRSAEKTVRLLVPFVEAAQRDLAYEIPASEAVSAIPDPSESMDTEPTLGTSPNPSDP